MMIFAFIFLLVIIGGGIVIGTFVFIGPEFDFRGNEANLLAADIGECVSSEAQTGTENAGFWLDNLADKSNFAFLSKKCGLDNEAILKNNLIKICADEKNPSDCINEGSNGDDKKVVFFTSGDFVPCGFPEKEREKFIGCSIIQSGKYTIIATSKQRIRLEDI